MKLSNDMYDRLKWIATIFAPALITLIAALGAIYGWSFTTTLTGTIAALDTFLGALLQISTSSYNKDQAVK